MRTTRLAVIVGAAATVTVGGCGWDRPFGQDDVKYLESIADQIRVERDRDGSLQAAQPQIETPLLPAQVPLLVPEGEERPAWALTLQKCVEIALANNPTLQVVRLDPAIEETRVQNALAAFDATLNLTAAWARTEEISTSVVSTGNFASLFGGGTSAAGEELEAVLNKTGQYQAELVKPLPTGGEFKIGTQLQRVRTSNVLVTPNPYYASDVSFTFSHSLLKGAGIEVNRAAIRIARLNKAVAVENFRAEVMRQLQQVETAYWQLSFAYADLKSRRAALLRAQETLKKVETKQQAGSASLPEVEQARQQYQEFRAEVLTALDRMHQADLELRRRMGVVLDDRRLILPLDEPSQAEVKPIWPVALQQAIQHRPELAQQRLALQGAHIAINVAQNALWPQLDFQALWKINGLGANPRDSIEIVTENDFHDWQVGLTAAIPIGNRSALADLRRRRLEYTQAKMRLHDTEQQVKQDVLGAVRTLTTAYALIPVRREQLRSSELRLKAAQAFYDEGRYTTDLLLEAEAELAQAQRALDAAIVSYNIALVNLELAKGTLLKYNNVTLAESDEDL